MTTEPSDFPATAIDDTALRLEASRRRIRQRMQASRAGADPGALATAVRVAEHVGNDALRSTAQRHPLALVGAAMAGGALFVWARPWRTVASSALVAGLMSQFGARLVSQIPLASLFDAVQGVAARRSG